MVDIEIIKCDLVNCYLLSQNNQSILIDTAIPKYKNYLYDKIKNKNIRLIILTHGHTDHVGNANFLSNKLNVPVAMHYNDYELSKDNTIHKIYADSLKGKILKFFSVMSFKTQIEKFDCNIFLKDNQSFEDYGVDGKIVELKGHTKGSIGIIVNNKDFIVGDAMMNNFGITPALIYENKKAMLDSLNKIKNSNVKTIYSGHGKPFDIQQIKF